MRDLGLIYSNAVFQDVSEIEDSGFAFAHVNSFEMAEEMKRHGRNRAIVYTVAPNGNKARYPNDVHEELSIEDWNTRMRLVGCNVMTSILAYNRFIAQEQPKDLMPITVARTSNVGGGAFMLPIVSIEDHARAYMHGLLDALETLPSHELKRVEFTYTKLPENSREVFRAAFVGICPSMLA